MTSSIPMFIPNIILDKNVYFENCITDSNGFLEKIKKENFFKNFENCNPDSKDCFDIKLYHSRNNLYKQEIVFDSVKNDSKKELYILNSIKMAFGYTCKLYLEAFRLNMFKYQSAHIYRQDSSFIFDEFLKKTERYKSILFLSQGEYSVPFKISNGIQQVDVFPKPGSVIILSPGTYYNIGYLSNKDSYYCVYNFESDII